MTTRELDTPNLTPLRNGEVKVILLLDRFNLKNNKNNKHNYQLVVTYQLCVHVHVAGDFERETLMN